MSQCLPTLHTSNLVYSMEERSYVNTKWKKVSYVMD